MYSGQPLSFYKEEKFSNTTQFYKEVGCGSTSFHLLDTCDPNWRRTRDGCIISGFVASILVLGLAIVELLIVIIAQRHQKKVVRYYLKFNFGYMSVLSVQIPVQYFLKCTSLATTFYYPAHACSKHR